MPRPSHLMILALTAAALYIYALASDNTMLALMAKPIPVLALIAWLRSTPVSPYRTWISIGLGFSVLGDILLAIPADLFVFGLAAFLCAHLAYLRGYCGITLRPALPALIFSAITGIALLGVLASNGLGPLLIPVALYALAISAMLWRTGLRGSGSTGCRPVRVLRQPDRHRPLHQPVRRRTVPDHPRLLARPMGHRFISRSSLNR